MLLAEQYVELYTDLANLLYESRYSNKLSRRNLTDDEKQDLFIECCNDIEAVLGEYNLRGNWYEIFT